MDNLLLLPQERSFYLCGNDGSLPGRLRGAVILNSDYAMVREAEERLKYINRNIPLLVIDGEAVMKGESTVTGSNILSWLVKTTRRATALLGRVGLIGLLVCGSSSGMAAAPSIPTKLSPGTTNSPGPVVSSSKVQLSWGAVTGASYYGLGVRDLATNNLVVSTNVYGASSYEVSLNLSGKYRWNVSACNAKNECSSYATAVYFQTPAPPNYKLSVATNGAGSGSVKCDGGTCASSYVSGTKLTLTASPASGSTFGGWAGACAGTSSCSITMTSDKTVAATFNKAAVNYKLSFQQVGPGEGSWRCNGVACPSSFPSGTTLTLTASPLPGSTFEGWAGACSGTASCFISMTGDKSVALIFGLVNNVAYPRMSAATIHPGVHVYSYSGLEYDLGKIQSNVRTIARAIKQEVLGSATASTNFEGNGNRVQLAIQTEVTPTQFSRDVTTQIEQIDFVVKKLDIIISTFANEGFAVHLLMNAHDLPVDGWMNINWSNKKWPEGHAFDPYQPCRTRLVDSKVCPYDVVFENFHKPLLQKLKEKGLTNKLAVVYILNEFDYRGPYEKTPPPSSSFWTASYCGSQPKWELCRKEALAYTAKRGYELLNAVANGSVPIGIKFQRFHGYSGWNKDTETGADQLSYLLTKVIGTTGGVIGYDCYWNDGEEATPCKSDRERLVQTLSSANLLGEYVKGRIEVSEYGVHCKGGPADQNRFTEGRRTWQVDVNLLTAAWKDLASGFNLFAFNARDDDGCYALANPDTNVVFSTAKSAFRGVREQIKTYSGK